MFVADILPTGFLAVQRAAVGAGDVTVVLGCGPVGLMAVLCAVGTARRVIEASGAPAALSSALHPVRPQGVVSVVGAHFEPDYPLNNGLMFEKEITLTFAIGNPGRDRERLLR